MTAVEGIQADSDKGIKDRKFCRGDVAIVGTIRATGGIKFPIKVVDISTIGFRMECLTYMAAGQAVFLSMPGFETLEAKIMWQTEWMYGCEFVRPLYIAVYEHIVRSYPLLETQPTEPAGFMYGASAGLSWVNNSDGSSSDA
jgi:hypothetical protein